jgi:acyl carrier protein
MNNITIESIEQQLRDDIAIITSNDKNTIDCNTSLALLGVDSLSLVEIFIAVENRFNLKLLNSNLCNDDLTSVHSLSNKIYSLLNKDS